MTVEQSIEQLTSCVGELAPKLRPDIYLGASKLSPEACFKKCLSEEDRLKLNEAVQACEKCSLCSAERKLSAVPVLSLEGNVAKIEKVLFVCGQCKPFCTVHFPICQNFKNIFFIWVFQQFLVQFSFDNDLIFLCRRRVCWSFVRIR